ncbi:MAG: flavodoxin-dependent (E)-4-hydroxy-3-methylbut-2-enyl-diphosphate synthase [Candidatus Aadella gelida]|nr:flavodoxin-dependent (E)-4-hydroxy-3-methylbut-2-enyl-diphosphate synthase [Candidatus Aadella gelida]
MKIKRRKTRTVNIGGVKIGSGHPIAIQSMTKTGTSDIEATVKQIEGLVKSGCEIIRVAVKDHKDAAAIADIKKSIDIPLVADIHFDHTLAIEAISSGADKIRINPGNISKEKDIDEVIGSASDKGIPIRIGVNSGSLTEMHSSLGRSAERMVDSALRYLEYFKKRKFEDLVISLKASEVSVTRDAYKLMAERCDHPFHVGVTAAGLPEEGIIKSSMGIGTLLLDGIGDTIRVSLTGDPEKEIDAAKNILSASGVRKFGPEIIACPTCGRCQVDLVPIVEDLKKRLQSVAHSPQPNDKPLLIALMGCEVNGPGEAKGADIGIAFGKGKGAIFSGGEIVKTVNVAHAVDELVKILKSGRG